MQDMSFLKKIEEQLRQYEHILSTTEDLLALVDRQYRYLTVNEAYVRAYGKSREEIIGHSVAELLGEEIFAGSLKKALDKCLAGEVVRYQAWFTYPDGQRRYKDVACYPYANSQNEISAVSTTVHDITEFFVAEQIRERQRQQLQSILDAIKDCVYVINADYEVEYANASLEEVFGSPYGKKCFEYLNDLAAPSSWCCMNKVLAGQTCSRLWESGMNGRRYEVHESPIILSDGRMAKVSIFHDISKRLADERELRRKSYIFDSIANNTPAVIYIKEVSGGYVYANKRFRNLFYDGFSAIKGKTDVGIFPPDIARQFQENDQKTLAAGAVTQFKEIVVQEGRLHTYLSIKVPLYDEAGTPWAVAGISSDISELKRLEKDLQEKNEHLLSLINATPDIICFKDGKGRWLLANDAVLSLFELEGVDYVGKKDSDLARFSGFYRDAFLQCEASDEQAWEKGGLSRADEVIPLPQGASRIYDVIKVPLFHDDGSRKALVVLGRDITARVESESALRQEMRAHEESLKELAQKNQATKDVNIALRVLLDQHAQARKDTEEQVALQVALQVEKLVMPYLGLLKSRNLTSEEKDYVDIIGRHLGAVTDSFVKNLHGPGLGLTEREILVADLVRQGKSTREIAGLLGLAYRTVEAYRNSLRNKFKLNNKKINLRQYLLSHFTSK